MNELEGKVALVTGANGGIGLETAIGLAKRGATVVMAVRNPEKGLAAQKAVIERTGSKHIELLSLDLGSLASVRAAAADFLSRFERLDLLVNNAGVMLSSHQLTEDGFEATLGVNHLGHFLLTNLLLDCIEATGAARIINVSSAGHAMTKGLKFDDLLYTRRRYRGILAYCESKLANVLFTTELARRLSHTDVVVHSLHPGVVRTRLARDGDGGWLGNAVTAIGAPFLISPERGAATTLHVATSNKAGKTTGKYWAKSRIKRARLPRNEAKDAARLWQISAELVGLEATAKAA